jgi:hypothetical protein
LESIKHYVWRTPENCPDVKKHAQPTHAIDNKDAQGVLGRADSRPSSLSSSFQLWREENTADLLEAALFNGVPDRTAIDNETAYLCLCPRASSKAAWKQLHAEHTTSFRLPESSSGFLTFNALYAN